MDAVDMIRHFEGCRLDAYQDDGRGVWTVGWGHTVDVRPGMRVTQHQADVMLESDVDLMTAEVRRLAPHATPNQLAAMVCFAFNEGPGRLADIARRLNAGDVEGAAWEFVHTGPDGLPHGYVFAGGKRLPGLVARRTAEQQLFLCTV